MSTATLSPRESSAVRPGTAGQIITQGHSTPPASTSSRISGTRTTACLETSTDAAACAAAHSASRTGSAGSWLQLRPRVACLPGALFPNQRSTLDRRVLHNGRVRYVAKSDRIGVREVGNDHRPRDAGTQGPCLQHHPRAALRDRVVERRSRPESSQGKGPRSRATRSAGNTGVLT
jgi:hypothetical protein